MRSALVLVLIAALVAGCGKRGDPRPPPPEAAENPAPAAD